MPAQEIGNCPKCGTVVLLDKDLIWQTVGMTDSMIVGVGADQINLSSLACAKCGDPFPDMLKSKISDYAQALGKRVQLEPTPTTPKDQETPILAQTFRVLAVLEMIGGLILCALLWPGEPEPGYKWQFAAYLGAITWISAGIIFGLLFLAVADGLRYLHDIREFLKRLADLPSMAHRERSE